MKTTQSFTEKQRRVHNLSLALKLAALGIYIFPSRDKTPLFAGWQTADTDYNPAQRAAEIDKAITKNGFPPMHVGCTKDAKVISRIWASQPDAVPSISCGPSGLYVIDADFGASKDGKRAKNGPAKLAEFISNGNIVIDGAVIISTQSGGEHLYFRNPDKLDSKAGVLRDLDCDVRGVGGQTVAPTAIRQDGKTYTIANGGTLFDLLAVPALPTELVNAVRTARETTEVKDEIVKATISKLEEAEVQPFEDIFDPITGYDIKALAAKDDEFATVFRDGTGDISRNRFKITRCLMREWPNMPVEHLLAFHSGWLLADGTEGAGSFNDTDKAAGEYNFRDIAREYAKGNSDHKVSDGSAFASVDDEGVDELPPEQLEIKKEKAAKKRRLSKTARVNPKKFKYLNTSAIPPRPFIWLDWLLLEELTLLIALGARGKSALMLSIAICMASGIDLLCSQQLFKARRIFLYNTEDSLREMQRRAGAFMEFHNFTAEMIAAVEANLFLQSGKDDKIVFTQTDGRTIAAKDKLITELEDFVIDEHIEYVMLDPLITLHDAGENDNNAMALVTQIFRDIQSNTSVGMMIAHHSRKVSGAARGGGQQDANDARGATSIVTAARVVLNINKVPKDQALGFGIDAKEDWRYFIVSKGDKVNLSPNDKSVVCFRMNSILADNGNEEFRKDNNLAISPVERRAVQAISDDQLEEVLSGFADKNVQYRSSGKSDSDVIELISGMMGRDSEDTQTIKDVRAMLKGWESSGWVVQAGEVITGEKNRSKRSVWRRGSKSPQAVSTGNFEAVKDEG